MENPQEAQTESVQITIEQAKEVIAMRDAAIRLIGNEDFKKVIEESYFNDEVLRLVDLRADLMLKPAQKDNIANMLHGIPALKMFLKQIINTGNRMETDLKDAMEEAENLKGEEN